MKRFIISILCFFGLPALAALGIYLWTDPFRCLHPFDIEDTDGTNREYLSTELYLHNRDSIHYDSFIFASSRGCGFNLYQWKRYLAENAQPYLFQGWSETLTGEYLKLRYLDESGVRINNAILMFDIPGSFSKQQLSHKALDMKHYMFTGGNRFTYNVYQFINFLQKPSNWYKSIKKRNYKAPYCADRITNDWYPNNQFDYANLPAQDSLKDCSVMTRNTFYARIKDKTTDVETAEPLINQSMEEILKHVRLILNEHQTDYKIVISPGICFTSQSVNPADLKLLESIFGADHVYNYSGINEFTTDINNFSDPAHFGRRVGFLIMQNLYEK